MPAPAFLSAAAVAPWHSHLPCGLTSRAPRAPLPATSRARHARMCAAPPRPTNAKETMARYGGAYLGSSVALSLLSFAGLYVLIDAGVDVRPALDAFGDALARTPLGRPEVLDRVGESGGTFALAYVAHKATSPIRFPPTLVLTEFVAKALGKGTGKEQGEGEGGEGSAKR